MERKCAFVNENGQRCTGNAMKNSDFCFWHSPDIPEEEKNEARRRGGRATGLRVREPLPPVVFRNSYDVALFLEFLINSVLQGKLDTQTASVLYNIAMKLNNFNLKLKHRYQLQQKLLSNCWSCEIAGGVFYCDLTGKELFKQTPLAKYDKKKGVLLGVFFQNELYKKPCVLRFTPKREDFVLSKEMTLDDFATCKLEETDDFETKGLIERHYYVEPEYTNDANNVFEQIMANFKGN